LQKGPPERGGKKVELEKAGFFKVNRQFSTRPIKKETVQLEKSTILKQIIQRSKLQSFDPWPF